MKKRFLVGLFVSILVLASTMVSVFAQENTEDVIEDAGYTLEGSGTEEDPYLIQNVDDLQNCETINVPDGYYPGDKIYYRFEKNIDMSGIELERPIIFHDNAYIDGNNKTISNVTTNNASNCLFTGLVDDSVIKDLSINNIKIKVDGNLRYNAGIIYSLIGTAENVDVTGKIEIEYENYNVGTSTPGIGGLVQSETNSILKDCDVDADIIVTSTGGGELAISNHIGGLVYSAFDSTIDNCSYKGKIIVKNNTKYGASIAGIVSSCSNTDIINCSVDAELSGASYISGLADRASGSLGYGEETKDVRIEGNEVKVVIETEGKSSTDKDVYASGLIYKLEASENSELIIKDNTILDDSTITSNYNAAGLISQLEARGAKVVIDGCENHADIASKPQSTKATKAAGLILKIQCLDGYPSKKGSILEVKNCINYGNISGTLESAGGIIDDLYERKPNSVLKIKNCINKGDITVNSLYSSSVAGIVRKMDEYPDSINGESVVLEECINEGNISNFTYGAGITNFIRYGRIINCINKGDIIADLNRSSQAAGVTIHIDIYNLENENDEVKIIECGNEGKICAKLEASGIVNDMDFGILGGCYNKGNIEGTGNNAKICGIVNSVDRGLISSCYNSGKISKTGSGTRAVVGGVVGSLMDCASPYLVIKNCFNSGDIDLSGDTGGDVETGGFLGKAYVTGHAVDGVAVSNVYNSGKIISSSNQKIGLICGSGLNIDHSGIYYLGDGTTLPAFGNNGVGNAVKLNATQMQNSSSFKGYDFSKVWTINQESDYKYPTIKGIDYETDTAPKIELTEEQAEALIRNALPDTNINESAKIEGPSISIGNKNLQLFSFEYGIGDVLSDNIDITVSYDAGTQDVKAVLGYTWKDKSLDNKLDENSDFVSTYKDIKSFYKKAVGENASTTELFNQYKNLREGIKKKHGSAGLSGNVETFGYVEIHVGFDSDNNPYPAKVNEGGLMVGVSGELSYDQPFPPPFSIFFWEIALSGELNGKFKFVNYDDKRDRCELETEGEIGLSAAAGAGSVDWDIYVKGGLTGTVGMTVRILPWINPYNNVTAEANLDGFIKHSVGGIPILSGEHSINLASLSLYPELELSTIVDDVGCRYNAPTFVSNEQLYNLSVTAGADAIDGDDAIYEFAIPQMIGLSDGRYLATYLDDSVAGYSGQIKLMYKLYDGENWGEASIAFSEGYADSGARLVTDSNGDTYIIFVRVNGVIDENTSVEDVVSKLDLYVAKFDEGLSSFTEPVKIGESGKFRSMYTLVEDEEGLVAIWTENEENSITPSSGDTYVYGCRINAGLETGEAEKLYSFSGNPASIKADTVSGELCVVYANDDKLYVNGEAKDMSEYGTRVTAPSIEGGKIYFIADNTLFSYDGTDVTDTKVNVNGSYQVCGNNVYYLVGDYYYSEIYKNEIGSEMPAIKLTNDKGYIGDISVLPGLTNDMILYSYQVVNEENDDPYGLCTLKFGNEFERNSAKITDIAYDVLDFIPGEDNEIEINIYNDGTEKLNNVKLVAKAGGVTIYDSIIETELDPSVGKNMTVNIPIPSDYDGSDIVFSLKADEMLDETPEYEKGFDYSIIDLDVSESDNTKITISNNSIVPAYGVQVELYDGDEDEDRLIDQINIGDMSANSTTEIDITEEQWSKVTANSLDNSKNMVVVVSSSDDEYELWNNVTTVIRTSGTACKHKFSTQTVKPTTTEMGYTLHVCSICSASYATDYVSYGSKGGNDSDEEGDGDDDQEDGKSEEEAKIVWKDTIKKISETQYELNLATKQKYAITELAKVATDGKNYKISYSNRTDSRIASMSNKGLVSAKKAGTSNIKLTKGDKEYSIIVHVEDPHFEYADPKLKSFAVNTGESISPSYIDCGLKPKFEIDKNAMKKGLATIDSDTGILTAIKKGNVKVSAVVGEGKYARKVTTKVVIYDPSIYARTTVVPITKSLALKVKNGAKDTIWTVADNNVATITSKGKLKAVGFGKTVVTAVNNNRKMTIEITVPEPELISVKDTVQIKKTLPLRVKNGVKETAWSVENGTGQAEISEKGVLKGIAPGTVIVKAVNNGKLLSKVIEIIN